MMISTHAPLAGRDTRTFSKRPREANFNPRAPCGARHYSWHLSRTEQEFQPTRPLRGATEDEKQEQGERKHFNPRAPCGARQGLIYSNMGIGYISTHAPLAGRDYSQVR